MNQKGLVGLIDCNNFYASCERVFNPRLNGVPVVVLSNNDGCVVARSAEAKVLGIPMAAPIFQLQEIVRAHNVQVLSSNYRLYGEMSNRVFTIVDAEAPRTEIYSIDEAFIDLSGLTPEAAHAFARRLRARVLQWTGLPVSIGIAPTKTLCKVANRRAKKEPAAEGVFTIADEAARVDSLERTDAADVWGVGSATARKLASIGVRTAFELARTPDVWVKKEMTVVGLRTVHELRGVPCIPFGEGPPASQSVACTRTFGRCARNLKELKEAVAAFVSRAAEKLRSKGMAAGCVTVFIRTNSFTPQAPQRSVSASAELPTPSCDTVELTTHALYVVERLYCAGFDYKKAGVILTGLVPLIGVQPDLFDPIDRHKRGRLMRALDAVNARNGKDTLKVAACGTARRWRMRQERRSPDYLCDWQALPTARAGRI